MSSDYIIAAVALLSILWSIYREAAFRSFRENYLAFQKQSIFDSQEMIRHVTQCLADVTATLGTTVRAVEGSTSITKEIKTELLNGFNQTETRIMSMLQRIEQQAIHIHNTQASIDGNSQNQFRGGR
jgi:hypothetical protein